MLTIYSTCPAATNYPEFVGIELEFPRDVEDRLPELADEVAGIFAKLTPVELLPQEEQNPARRRQGKAGLVMMRRRTTLSQLGRKCEDLPSEQQVSRFSVYNYFKGKPVGTGTRFAIATALETTVDNVPD
jgi:hypothetical protein